MNDLHMTGAKPEEVWPLVRDFHYSKRMPSVIAIAHCFAWRESGGLFGDYGDPLAAIIYSYPVSRNAPKNMVELIRLVRRNDFNRPLSQFVSWSMRWLKTHTDFDAVLSYADTTEGHHGGIYQATNFAYVHSTGKYQDGVRNKKTGEFIHGRQCFKMFGSRSQSYLMDRLDDNWELAYSDPKYLYVYPLKKRLKRILSDQGWQALPYPKPDMEQNNNA